MKALLALILMAPTAVGAFSMDMPLDCKLGENCHIQQYVDRDPGRGHHDFTCGTLSYQRHEGTDFALPNLAAMRQGVAVLAAQAGTVKGVRDGMADIAVNAPGAPRIKGRECGNGLVIDHGAGWETQYCHLARGSLRHKVGDRVAQGQQVGMVGLSGNTEFPHLHLSLRHNGKTIDPFAPHDATSCGPAGANLWQTKIAYQPGAFLNIGLSDRVPDWAAIKEGLPPSAPTPQAEAMVIWAHYYGNQRGDQIDLRVTGPDGGEVIANLVTLERTQAAGMRAIGKRLNRATWPTGRYRLEAKLLREGKVIDSHTAQFVMR